MVIFGIIVAVALSAVAYVLWQVKDDNELIDSTAEPLSPAEIKKNGFFAKKESKKVASDFGPLKLNIPSKAKDGVGALDKKKSRFLNFFKFKKNEDFNFDVPTPTPISSLKEALEIEKRLKEKQAVKSKGADAPAPTVPNVNEAPIGTASIKTQSADQDKKNPELALSKDDAKKLDGEINASLQLSEIKEKHEKLGKLFNEKSEELERLQKNLDSELKNKKEFNKIKDLLEKELREQKDRNKQLQGEIVEVNTENDSNKRRVSQLDGKVSGLEKDILQKEKEIDELLKRMQTFASPGTSASPPVKGVAAAPAHEAKEEPAVVEPEKNQDSKPAEAGGGSAAIKSESDAQDQMPAPSAEAPSPAEAEKPAMKEDEQEPASTSGTVPESKPEEPSKEAEKEVVREQSAELPAPVVEEEDGKGVESNSQENRVKEGFLHLKPDVVTNQETPSSMDEPIKKDDQQHSDDNNKGSDQSPPAE